MMMDYIVDKEAIGKELDRFDVEIYPIYHVRGYSKNTALQVHTMNVFMGCIGYFLNRISGDSDDDNGDGWKGEDDEC